LRRRVERAQDLPPPRATGRIAHRPRGVRPARPRRDPGRLRLRRQGNLWITLVNADRLIALTPSGEVLTLLDDGDPAKVAEWDRHFHAGTMTPEILGSARGTIAPMTASVTFGGPDLRTVYLGSLMGTTIPCFRSPVPGLPPSHGSRPATA